MSITIRPLRLAKPHSKVLTIIPFFVDIIRRSDVSVVLPFCLLGLNVKEPASRKKYPDFLRTWGDHIKTRRLDLKLTKRQLSFNIHASESTIYLWERNKVRPSLSQIPKIIEFLGRDPFERETEKLGDKIREY